MMMMAWRTKPARERRMDKRQSQVGQTTKDTSSGQPQQQQPSHKHQANNQSSSPKPYNNYFSQGSHTNCPFTTIYSNKNAFDVLFGPCWQESLHSEGELSLYFFDDTMSSRSHRDLPQKTDPSGKPTISAHPARFSPDDKFSKERITCKKRFGVLPTQVSPTLSAFRFYKHLIPCCLAFFQMPPVTY